MKKCFFLALCLLTVFMAKAGPISEQEAYQIAQQFMQGKWKSVQSNLAKRKVLKSARVQSAQKNLYIFNAEEKGGFVIVSGDDRTPTILGYADSGMLEGANIPCNIEWLLNYYDKSISSLSGQETSATVGASTTRVKISPIISTIWGQDDPYNALCPTISGNLCKTGCAATAMAQIINYNRWPQGETAALPDYELPATSFDWNNMTFGNIARLMLYCGRAVKMEYGVTGSGANTKNIAPAFIDVFGYKETVSHVKRDDYNSDDEWEKLLYDELSAGRPVLYAGVDYSALGGHGFVIDGYADGLWHVNWGWEGYYDGYFRLTGLNPYGTDNGYNSDQEMIIGICPPDGAVIERPQVSTVCIDCDETWRERTNATEQFPFLNVCSIVESTSDITRQVGLALYDGNGMVELLAEETHDFSTDSQHSFDIDVTLSPTLPIGVYSILTVSRSGEGEEWVPDNGSTATYIKVRITETDMYVTLYPTYTDLGKCSIDGINYVRYSAGGNYQALVAEKEEGYSGDLVIPANIEYQDTTYRVVGVQGSNVFGDAVTSIDLSNCKKLDYVGLTSTSLSSIVLGKCPIETLHISGNIKSLDLSQCKKLETLYCNGTLLTSLDLSQCKYLKELYCSNNDYLTSLNLSQCSRLEYLGCVGCKLNTLDLGQCKLLTEVHCGSNNFTSLDFSPCEKLTTLECQNNGKLASLTIGKCPLNELECAKNSLTSLDLSQCEYLTELSCESNKLETLKLGKCVLTRLTCYDNQLTMLDLSQCNYLNSVYCYNNKIATLTLGNCPLATLYCYSNDLTTLDVSQCEYLQTLNCRENSLTSLNVSQCAYLSNLWCSNNNLTSLIINQCPELTRLDCGSNSLTAIDVSQCTKLTNLSCGNNNLTSLDVSPCTELESLNCGSNSLTAIDVSQCTKLTDLSCDNNNLTSLDVSPCTELESLNCGDNSFGFSQITPHMYELIKPVGGYLGYKYPYDLCVGDTLDLSHELTAWDGSPVTISVSHAYRAIEGDNGKYEMVKNGNKDSGNTITMRCKAMPKFYFYGEYNVNVSSGVGQLPMDGMKITINGGVVCVSGLADDVKAALYDDAGRMVSSAKSGSELSITAPCNGVYILHLNDAKGRSAAIKLMVK